MCRSRSSARRHDSSMEERPPSFHEEHISDWGSWVLDHGLPALPSSLGDEDAVPVAMWAGHRFGAVLNVQWYVDDEDGEKSSDTEVLLFRRSDEGWEEAPGSGGRGWYDP